jgi:hypothetical protein
VLLEMQKFILNEGLSVTATKKIGRPYDDIRVGVKHREAPNKNFWKFIIISAFDRKRHI